LTRWHQAQPQAPAGSQLAPSEGLRAGLSPGRPDEEWRQLRRHPRQSLLMLSRRLRL